MTRSVAVMGAGPGGLATAMLLAAEGAQVDVSEKEDRVGGRTARLRARRSISTAAFAAKPV